MIVFLRGHPRRPQESEGDVLQVIAVTGASGFIGRALVKRLCSRKDTLVHVLTREKGGTFENKDPNLNVFAGDLLQQDSIERFLERDCTVVNLAFMSSGSREDNLLAVDNLINASARRNVKRVVHCSTAVVAGKTSEDVVTESTLCRPVDAYEITKYEIEEFLLNRAPGNFDLGILRPTAVFGPGGKNLLKLADALTCGQRTLNGFKSCLFGMRKMNLVCLENVVSALCFLVDFEQALNGEAFIVSDDEDPANNYRDIERIIAQNLGGRQSLLPIFTLPPFVLSLMLLLKGKSNTSLSRVYSSQKIIAAGFEKAVSLEQGLVGFAEWYKERLASGAGKHL